MEKITQPNNKYLGKGIYGKLIRTGLIVRTHKKGNHALCNT